MTSVSLKTKSDCTPNKMAFCSLMPIIPNYSPVIRAIAVNMEIVIPNALSIDTKHIWALRLSFRLEVNFSINLNLCLRVWMGMRPSIIYRNWLKIGLFNFKLNSLLFMIALLLIRVKRMKKTRQMMAGII